MNENTIGFYGRSTYGDDQDVIGIAHTESGYNNPPGPLMFRDYQDSLRYECNNYGVTKWLAVLSMDLFVYILWSIFTIIGFAQSLELLFISNIDDILDACDEFAITNDSLAGYQFASIIFLVLSLSMLLELCSSGVIGMRNVRIAVCAHFVMVFGFVLPFWYAFSTGANGCSNSINGSVYESIVQIDRIFTLSIVCAGFCIIYSVYSAFDIYFGLLFAVSPMMNRLEEFKVGKYIECSKISGTAAICLSILWIVLTAIVSVTDIGIALIIYNNNNDCSTIDYYGIIAEYGVLFLLNVLSLIMIFRVLLAIFGKINDDESESYVKISIFENGFVGAFDTFKNKILQAGMIVSWQIFVNVFYWYCIDKKNSNSNSCLVTTTSSRSFFHTSSFAVILLTWVTVTVSIVVFLLIFMISFNIIRNKVIQQAINVFKQRKNVIDKLEAAENPKTQSNSKQLPVFGRPLLLDMYNVPDRDGSKWGDVERYYIVDNGIQVSIGFIICLLATVVFWSWMICSLMCTLYLWILLINQSIFNHQCLSKFNTIGLFIEAVTLFIATIISIILSCFYYFRYIFNQHNYRNKYLNIQELINIAQGLEIPHKILLVSYFVEFGIVIHLSVIFDTVYNCVSILTFHLDNGLNAWIILNIMLLILCIVMYKQLNKLHKDYIDKKTTLNTIPQLLQLGNKDYDYFYNDWFCDGDCDCDCDCDCSDIIHLIWRLIVGIILFGYALLSLLIVGLCMGLMIVPTENKRFGVVGTSWTGRTFGINWNQAGVYRGDTITITVLTIENMFLLAVTLPAVFGAHHIFRWTDFDRELKYDIGDGILVFKIGICYFFQFLIMGHDFVLFWFDAIKCDTFEWYGVNIAHLIALWFINSMFYGMIVCIVSRRDRYHDPQQDPHIQYRPHYMFDRYMDAHDRDEYAVQKRGAYASSYV